MSRINFVPLIKQEGLQNAIIRNKKEPSPLIGYAKRIETYDDIVSLPSNANGQISCVVKGNTRTNLAKSSNMDKDSNGDGVVDDFTKLAQGQISGTTSFDSTKKAQKIEMTSSSGGGNISVYQELPTNPGDIFSASVSCEVANLVNAVARLTLQALDSSNNILQDNSVDATVSGVLTLNNFVIPTGAVKLRVLLRLNTTVANASGIVWFKNLLVEKAASAGSYISSGTKSTLCGVVRSVGKNLIDESKKYLYLQSSVVDNDTYWVVNNGQYGGYEFGDFKILAGQTYTLSFVYKTSDNIGHYAFRDIDTNDFNILGGNKPLGLIRDNAEHTKTITFTADKNRRIRVMLLRFGSTGTVYYKKNTIQLEKGLSATTYEPYKETVAYLPNIVLRSLPNGVKDEFNVVEGKYTKRVSDTVSVSGTMYASIDKTTYTNVDVVKTTAFSLAQAGTTGKDGMTRLYDKNGVELTEVSQTDIDNTASVGKYYWHTDKTLWIIVAKGAYADITAARTGLGTMQLNYQLASPIITKHEIFGDLKVFPSGTIYFEPTLWGFINFDYGQSSKTITTPDVPIGSIRKVIRYDVTDDGRLVETDVTADCTHNGTALTINNAEPKKTYFYDCEVAPGYYTSAEKIIDVGTHDGVVEHDYGAAAADWVLSTNEALATMLVCKNAGGAAKIIAPPAKGKMYIIRNESGQTITIKTASSTGVTVANGKTATVIFYNTDFIKIGEV